MPRLSGNLKKRSLNGPNYPGNKDTLITPPINPRDLFSIVRPVKDYTSQRIDSHIAKLNSKKSPYLKATYLKTELKVEGQCIDILCTNILRNVYVAYKNISLCFQFYKILQNSGMLKCLFTCCLATESCQ